MSLRVSANLSILYPDLPVHERPKAAASDGFCCVESWWPFATPTGDTAGVMAFREALREAGVRLVALNLDAGETSRGDRGLLSHPAFDGRLSANLGSVADILVNTSCRIVNALYGNREPGIAPDEQDRHAMRQLVRIADRLGELGATVVVETLNQVDHPRYPLTDIAASAEVVRQATERCRHGNVRLLLDTYHLAAMGTDPAAAVRSYAPLIGHVQFADFPGRGRPGTGRIDFAAVEHELLAAGYRGFVGYEYLPANAARDTREGIT